MNVLAVTLLVLLQLSPVRGPKMANGTLFGIRLDVLRREAQLVLGRKQAVLEMKSDEPMPPAPVVPGPVPSSGEPGVTAGRDLPPDMLGDRDAAQPLLSHHEPGMINKRDRAGYSLPFLASLSPPAVVKGRPVRYNAIGGMPRSRGRAVSGAFLLQLPLSLLVR